jgi:hypothetical protein
MISNNNNSIGLSISILLFVSIFSGILFVSCGVSAVAYGVVLWPEKDSSLKSGEIVKITVIQKKTDTYIVYDEKTKQSVITPVWRIQLFKSMKLAKEFYKKYEPYVNTYAYGERDGVPPVREEALNSGTIKIIAKTTTGQLLKVIGKSEEKTSIEDMNDYWYEVLIEYQGIAKDGEYKAIGGRGFCYGYYLKVFSSEADAQKEVRNKVSEMGTDPKLQNLLNNTWRPIYFKEMIERGKINTNLFNENIGLFPLPLSKVIEIVTPKGKFNFPYSEIIKVKEDSFSFKGTDLRIQALSEKKLSVTFIEDSKQVTALYVLLDDNIEELYEKEKEARDKLYTEFLDRGASLVSTAYGTITLEDKKRINWTGFDKLVPAIIPKDVSGDGWVDFNYILAPDLRKNYDGVVSFYFKEYKGQKNFNFVYKFTDDGVRLYFIPLSNIDDYKVTRTGTNPIVIFFSFRGN